MARALYEIVVQARFGDALTHWFGDLEVEPYGPSATRLRGWFDDQAALHGLLRQFGDLGVELSSVRCLSPEEDASSDQDAASD